MKTHRMTKNKVHAIQYTGSNSNTIMSALIANRVGSTMATVVDAEGEAALHIDAAEHGVSLTLLIHDWLIFDAAGLRACDDYDFHRVYERS